MIRRAARSGLAVVVAGLIVAPAAHGQEKASDPGEAAESASAAEPPSVAALKTRAMSGDREAARAALNTLRERASGDAAAAMALGALYESGELPDIGAQLGHAYRWYRRAARDDHGEAQLKVARMALAGRGVAKDGGLARKWFERAAASGVPAAMAAYGRMLVDGVAGGQQFDAGVKWLMRAANRGRGDAQARLDRLYWADQYDFRDDLMPEDGRATGAEAGRLRDNLDYLLAPFTDTEREGLHLTWKGERVVAPAPGRDGWLMVVLPLATLEPAEAEDRRTGAVRLGTVRLFVREKDLGTYDVRLSLTHRLSLVNARKNPVITVAVSDQSLRGTFSLPLFAFTDLEARFDNVVVDRRTGGGRLTLGGVRLSQALHEGGSGRWSGHTHWRVDDGRFVSGGPVGWHIRLGRAEKTVSVTELNLGFYSRLFRVLGVDRRTGRLDPNQFRAGSRFLPDTLPMVLGGLDVHYTLTDLSIRPPGIKPEAAAVVDRISLEAGGRALDTDDARMTLGLELESGDLTDHPAVPTRLDPVAPRRLTARASAGAIPARQFLDGAMTAFVNALEAAGQEARDEDEQTTPEIMPAVETVRETVRKALDTSGTRATVKTVRLKSDEATAEIDGTVKPDQDAKYGVTADLVLRLKGDRALKRALAGEAAHTPGWLKAQLEAWRAEHGGGGGEATVAPEPQPVAGTPAAVRAAFDRLRDAGREVLKPDGSRWVAWDVALRKDGSVRVGDRPLAALRGDITTLREQTPLPALTLEKGGWGPVSGTEEKASAGE